MTNGDQVCPTVGKFQNPWNVKLSLNQLAHLLSTASFLFPGQTLPRTIPLQRLVKYLHQPSPVYSLLRLVIILHHEVYGDQGEPALQGGNHLACDELYAQDDWRHLALRGIHHPTTSGPQRG